MQFICGILFHNISIHALREEGDQGNTAALSVTTIFLSTPSARRATAGIRRAWRRIPISIHALREEGDLPASALPLTAARFLSTPSARRATAGIRRAWRRIPISIHALREEGDGTHGPHRRERPNFYPRPPRGGRPATTHTAASPVFYFYPRPPRGGRLRGEMGNLTPGTISIHALREEGDCDIISRDAYARLFLSTPSARRATAPLSSSRSRLCNFYPRPPRGGRRAF